MPTYDYLCQTCGKELEIVHRMSETMTTLAHEHATSSEPCDGPLERLISAIGVNTGGLTDRTPSDAKLKRLGFTKFVKGSKGYERAFGNASLPDRNK